MRIDQCFLVFLGKFPVSKGFLEDDVLLYSVKLVAEVQEALAKTSLIGRDLEDLQILMAELGLEKFRAKQIYKWIYAKSVRDFDQMTDLSKKTREILKEKTQVGSLKLKDKQVSKDGTVKFLFELSDGNVVESVLMRFETKEDEYQDYDEAGNAKYERRVSSVRHTACISSQVGCAVGCTFCATGTLGFKKNLNSSEIIEQVLFVQAETGERVDNIVYMGQGEPLHNYDELVESIHTMREDVGIGARHITVSTSGIVPKIHQLADEGVQLTLALSLHDPEDKDRDYLVPINKKWKIKDQIDALQNYVNKTNRRVTIEYVLLSGVNDSPHKAKLLGQLVKDLHCNINIIPYNPTDVKDPYQRSSKERIQEFKTIVEQNSKGKKVTVRQEKGTDIDGACGQLANKQIHP